MERDKWDTKKLDRAMKESEKEVEQLNLDLFNLVVKFEVRALARVSMFVRRIA
jgi:hypothetical protein